MSRLVICHFPINLDRRRNSRNFSPGVEEILTKLNGNPYYYSSNYNKLYIVVYIHNITCLRVYAFYGIIREHI